MSRRLAILTGALIVATACTLAGVARAPAVLADEPPVIVRGGEHAGFGRLVFDFPVGTPYTAEIVEGVLLVSLPTATRFDLSPLSRDLEDYIGPSRAGEDGKSVRIPLKAGFTMKHYTLGPKVVIDLIDPPGGLPQAASAAADGPPMAAASAEGGPTGEAAAEPKAAPATEPMADGAAATEQGAREAKHMADATPAAIAGGTPEATADTMPGTPPDAARDAAAAAPPAVPPAAAPADPPADPLQPTAEQGPRVMVRVGEHAGFSRMVFDWPFSVPFRIEEAPGKATIWFGRPAQLDLSRYRLDPPERVGALVPRAVAEGLAVDLALPKGARLTHFTDGPLVVVDVVGGELPANGTAQTANAPAAKKDVAPDKAAPEQPAPAPAAAPTELLPDAMKGQLAEAAAGAQETAAQAAPAEAAEAAEAMDPATPAAPAQPAKAPEAASGQSPAAAEPQPAAAGAEAASAPEVDLISANSSAAEASVDAAPGEPAKPRRSIALRFNWAEPVGAAAFLYGGRLWLVFDRPVKSDIAGKITKAAPALKPVEQLEHAAATILRLRLPVGFTAQLKTDGDDWVVDLRRHEAESLHELNAVVDYSDEQARLRVALQMPGQVITVTDPDLGALLWVVPSKAPGLAMARQFSLPEVRLLPTFQGLAVEPRSDRVTVALDEQGVLITGDGGFNVSAATLRESQSGDEVAFDTGRRLLDLETWRGAEPFLTRKQELQQTTVAADSGSADLARLDVARFYFAHGLASEALGALDLIERSPKRLDADPQLLLLRGASALLDNEFEAAAESLLHPALDSEWDAHLWRGALAAASEDWPSAAQFLRETEPLIEDYPAPVRNRLWLLAAEAQIQIADGAAAQQYLDQVRKNEPTVFDQARIDYLEGRRLVLEGETELASELWRTVAASGYGAAAARARLALIEQGMDDGTLSRVDAIADLEHLQFAWRGDTFEFVLLQRLGELYLEQNRFRDALLTMRQAASYLPHAVRSKTIAQRMREVFADLFMTDLGKAVPPVAALGIYREFRELTPGGEEGDRLVARLADRLVEVDLLEQAAELLQGQIDHRLAGQERAATGSRVAMIHLLDRRPKEALTVLAQTDMEELPESLVKERRLLRARALIESDRSGEGLGLLGEDKSEEAQRLRAQVYWTERRWPEAAATLEELLPETLPSEADQSEESARLIASLAVAYTLAGDRNGLADLDWRYGNFMTGTAQAEAFAMLTGDLNSGAIISIADELASVGTIQAFMVDYRERLGAPAESTLN